MLSVEVADKRAGDFVGRRQGHDLERRRMMPLVFDFFNGLKIVQGVGVGGGHIDVIILRRHLGIMDDLVNVAGVNASGQRVPEFGFDELVRAIHDVFIEM
jgi:hypothetical protein